MKTKGHYTALAPWYGSNRSLAERVGTALAGLKWIGVPFAGGMSELLHLQANTIVVSDLHRHIINFAQVAADPDLNLALRKRLADLPHHPDTLAAAQESCRKREDGTRTGRDCPLWWACDYFVCAWMARNGKAGTGQEFDAGLSLRWDGDGGDSAMRFRRATESLAAWQEIMRRCTFQCLDVFAFLGKVKDRPKHGLYLDPPFPDVGSCYKHTFTDEQHRRLAKQLAAFRHCKVVCRFYRHPLVEELYPADRWKWTELTGGKTQTNAPAPEVLIENRPAAEG